MNTELNLMKNICDGCKFNPFHGLPNSGSTGTIGFTYGYGN